MVEMYNKELERQLHELFIGLNKTTDNIIINSQTNKAAADRIMRLISSSISAEAERYMIDMYSCLVNKIKEEAFFKKLDNLNAFYRLNLREEINNRFQFNIENIDAYKTGIEYKEVNRFYIALITAASTMVLEVILKFTFLSKINIPFFLIIVSTLANKLQKFSLVIFIVCIFLFLKSLCIDRKTLADSSTDIGWYHKNIVISIRNEGTIFEHFCIEDVIG